MSFYTGSHITVPGMNLELLQVLHVVIFSTITHLKMVNLREASHLLFSN